MYRDSEKERERGKGREAEREMDGRVNERNPALQRGQSRARSRNSDRMGAGDAIAVSRGR